MSGGTEDEPDGRAVAERRAELVSTAIRDATAGRPVLLRGGRTASPLPCLSVADPRALRPARRAPWTAIGLGLTFLLGGVAGYLIFRLAR